MKGKLAGALLTLLLIIAIIIPTVTYTLFSSSGSPTLSVQKIYNTSLQKGRTIIVNLTVSNVPSIIACDVNLAFNASVLRVATGNSNGYLIGKTYYDIYEGPFLSSSGATEFLINGVNNGKGTISAIVDALITSGKSSSGSGVLASINFTCVNATTNTIISIANNSFLENTPTTKLQNKIANGLITAGAPPGVWTELWFQAALIVIIVEIIIVVLGIFVTIRWLRSRAEAESKESDEVDKLFR